MKTIVEFVLIGVTGIGMIFAVGVIIAMAVAIKSLRAIAKAVIDAIKSEEGL